MAENHPVGFQWVMEAKRRGAKLIHVDPRFTRTSAMADLHVPIRAGTDIAFLGGIISWILENGRDFREYVVPYTNAATIVSEEFRDTEDLDGLFSGYDDEAGSYDPSSWQYEGMSVGAASGQREQGNATGDQAHGAHGAGFQQGEPPHMDPTLEHPRCVYQILRRHYRRYTPELVEQTCGISRDVFLEVCESLAANSGRERTSAFAYAVGWTQHTVGVQYIRAASIIQLLLGNVGRPGGGIMALRGHASIQGSTDVPTLFNLLPGYLPMPHLHAHQTLDDYVESSAPPTGFWGNMRSYTVSLLKAWWGDAATAGNDFCFDHVPRITGDHSTYPTTMGMVDGWCKGYFVMGQNPVVGSANGGLQRAALRNLDWLVVREMVETETASFWYDAPEIDEGSLRPEDIGTEVFLLPAAAHTEKKGTFTNTQRLLQWREQAVEPEGDRRSELWFMFHLGRIVREKLAASGDPKDRPILDLTWDYPTEGAHDDPDAEHVLREISGFDASDNALGTYLDLRDDGSTSCGCWIYCGVYADEVNQANRRKPGSEQDWVAAEWGWAWPLNRRILYNRASADPDGNPWSERKKYVWWDAGEGKWTGLDVPDFSPTTAPDYEPPEGATAQDALRGTEPFIMQADGKGWLYVPSGLVDGPLPTHYEPHESPFPNPLYADQQANPARQSFWRRDNRYNATHGTRGSERFPFVLTTYRLTEHHTAGGMSRWLPYLSELQPEMFCEVSPELAELRGLEHRGWATIVTARDAIEARVLVTDRMVPQTIQGKRTYAVGLPYHWGRRGVSKGESANDLVSIAMDPNVQIGEYKALTCDIRAGRRPRGSARRDLVDSYPEQPAPPDRTADA
jgi:formate dehydrogenase major subunit